MAARRAQAKSRANLKKRAPAASGRSRKSAPSVSPVSDSVISSYPAIDFKKSIRRYGVVVAVVLVLVLLGVWKKHWVVAATVNGSPISGVEVLRKLDGDYRAKALESLVNEKIVLDEAKKNNALPTSDQVKSRIAEIETQYGGADNFNNLIKQEGQTRESVEQQIKFYLALENLYGSQATVSAEEVENFVTQNKEQLSATEPAKQREEAAKSLKDSKLQTIIQQKFLELKQKATVKLF